MMNRKFLLISFLLFICIGWLTRHKGSSQSRSTSVPEIKWMMFEQVTTVTKSSLNLPEEIIVDLFTDKWLLQEDGFIPHFKMNSSPTT